MKNKFNFYFVTVFALLLLCQTPSLADDKKTNEAYRKAWNDVFQLCIQSDFIKEKNVLYVGASSNVNIGDVWRIKENQSYVPRYSFSDLFPDEGTRNNIITTSTDKTCTNTKVKKWSVKLGIPFSTKIPPISVNLGLLLDKTKDINVTLDNLKVYDIKEKIYEEALTTIKPDNIFRIDLGMPNRFVVTRVFRVKGMKVILKPKTTFDANLKAEFAGKTIGTGNEGADLKIEFSTDNTAILTSSEEFTVAIEIGSLTGTEFNIGGGLASKYDINQKVTLLETITFDRKDN